MTLCYQSVLAIGFGEADVRSSLGEPLRVQIPMSGASDDVLVPSCIKVTLSALDGELIDTPKVELPSQHLAGQPVYLNITTRAAVSEPASKLSVAMICGTSVRREYPLLLDFTTAPVTVAQPEAISLPDVTNQPNPVPSKKVNHVAKSSSLDSARPSTKPTKPKSSEKHHAKPQPEQVHDVLKVSGDDLSNDFDLKLSQSLSNAVPHNEQQLDQQRVEENRRAQAQFAAILRGENPDQVVQDEIKRQQQRVDALSTQLENLKKQDLARKDELPRVSPLLIALVAAVSALFVALVALIIVAIRRAREKEERSWLDVANEQRKNVVDIVDYLQSTAEKGNLDPNPLPAKKEPAPNEVNIGVGRPVINKEEPAPKFKKMGLPALEDTNSSTFNFFGSRNHSIHIEEISDITQEAEFWMSVNDPHRAIEILEPQSHDDNPTTPVPWLYLLDLYRLVGDDENYRSLRERFKRKFNAKIPNFHEETEPTPVHEFEDFPHLVTNCCTLWNSDDVIPYLQSLLVDNREGERIGFDLPVYLDNLFLLAICSELKRTQYSSRSKNSDRPELAEIVDTDIIVDPDTLNFDAIDFRGGKKDNR